MTTTTVAKTNHATPNAAQLQQLADQHLPILRKAARNIGFRHQMPEGGAAAIEAGLVGEADPTWMMSDDLRACNAFILTELGRQVAHHLGWTCQCSGCREEFAHMGREPVAVAIDDFCGSCQSSISRYGVSRFREEPCCPYHRITMERNGAAEPFLTAADDTLAKLAENHAAAITAAVNRTEFDQVDADMQNAINAGFVKLRPTRMAGLDQDPLWLNLTREGQKAAAIMGITAQRKTHPKWKWHKHARLGWVASTEATNAHGADEPRKGNVISVVRRHGGVSQHTVTEIRRTDDHVKPPMIFAIVEQDQDTHDVITDVEAETSLDPEPVRYVKHDQVPEKPWVTPTPASKPILWRWRRRASQWVATGSRPLCQDEDPPQPGQLITVRRRDRSESRQRVLSYCGVTRDSFPQLTVTPA